MTNRSVLSTIFPGGSRVGRGDQRTDADLLARYTAGDQRACDALVRRYGALVWRAVVPRTADRHEAEDAFQATFLTLVRVARRLQGRDSLAGWLYTVAGRCAGKVRRTAARAAQERSPLPAADPSPLDTLTARELLAAVDQEIQALPERFRLPILLCGLEGLSREVAAALLGWSPGSLKGRLERGRRILHARLARRGLVLPAGLTLGLLSATTPPRLLATPPRPRALSVAAAVARGLTRPGRILALMLLVAGAVGLGFATTHNAGLRHRGRRRDPPLGHGHRQAAGQHPRAPRARGVDHLCSGRASGRYGILGRHGASLGAVHRQGGPHAQPHRRQDPLAVPRCHAGITGRLFAGRADVGHWRRRRGHSLVGLPGGQGAGAACEPPWLGDGAGLRAGWQDVALGGNDTTCLVWDVSRPAPRGVRGQESGVRGQGSAEKKMSLPVC